MLTTLAGIILVIACTIAYFTPPYFDTKNHFECDFHLYSDPIPSINGFQTRRIEQSESFCLPSPTGRRTQVHLSTIIVQPVANQKPPEANFQTFFESHSHWIEERLREGSTIWYQPRKIIQWTENLVNFQVNRTRDYFPQLFPHESLPPSFVSVTPHQHMNPGPMLMFVQKQSAPKGGLTTFHKLPENLPSAPFRSPIHENGSPYEPVVCFTLPNNCSTDAEGTVVLKEQSFVEFDGMRRYSLHVTAGSIWMTKAIAATFENTFARALTNVIFSILKFIEAKSMGAEELDKAESAFNMIWSNTQIIRPNAGDVMISHGWVQAHARVGTLVQGKKFIVRELIPCRYIKDEFECMNKFESESAQAFLRNLEDNQWDPNAKAEENVAILNFIENALQFFSGDSY